MATVTTGNSGVIDNGAALHEAEINARCIALDDASRLRLRGYARALNTESPDELTRLAARQIGRPVNGTSAAQTRGTRLTQTKLGQEQGVILNVR